MRWTATALEEMGAHKVLSHMAPRHAGVCVCVAHWNTLRVEAVKEAAAARLKPPKPNAPCCLGRALPSPGPFILDKTARNDDRGSCGRGSYRMQFLPRSAIFEVGPWANVNGHAVLL